MKSGTIIALMGVAAVSGAAGWFAARYGPGAGATANPSFGRESASGERRIAYYQSAMHPWVKSDKPGKCTICGMELTPVFEGETGLETQPGLVTLSSNSINVLDVRTAEVRRGPLIRVLRVAGTIDADATRQRVLSAYVGGRIEELFVNFVGAEVEAGQPLARFYSPMLLEAERQYFAVSRVPSTATDASADASFLVQTAAQRLRQMGLTDAQIEGLRDKSPTNAFSEILAPMAGTVVERFVYAGQYVMEGEKLFELADFSTMWFQFDAYEQDLPWLQPGQKVEVITPALPGRTFEAPIRFVDPNVGEMTRSSKVRVEIANPPVNEGGVTRRLLSRRLYAEGKVHLTAPEVVRVPRSAVLSPDPGAMVYVDRGGGAYERRPVKLGRVGDADFEVLSGLEPGERVVVQGNLMIDAQAQINLTLAAADHVHETSAKEDGAPGLPADSRPLTPVEIDALRAFVVAVDGLRAALAADDLTAFGAAVGRLPDPVEGVKAAFEAGSPWRPLVMTAVERAVFPEPADLRSARQAYFPLSQAAVELVQALRGREAAFRELKVYRCPMTAESFDGAPRRAEWLQLAPPLRNPWFGAVMLDCGTEVPPSSPGTP